jgi:AcrR family transcriptional regulator
MTEKSSKNRILEVAEELFSKNGYDGTSVDSIANKANVNKALIYYYFDNKEDIIVSIFKNVQEDLIEHLKDEFEGNGFDAREKLKKEIEYLKGRRKVIALLLMESFKENRDDFLFKCAEIVIGNEIKLKNEVDNFEREKLFINEFFTGFIPILTFIAYEDKWCNYFDCNKDKALDYFLDAFMSSHF